MEAMILELNINRKRKPNPPIHWTDVQNLPHGDGHQVLTSQAKYIAIVPNDLEIAEGP